MAIEHIIKGPHGSGLTKNEKLLGGGVGLVAVVAYFLRKKQLKLQSLRSVSATGQTTQVVVPVPTSPFSFQKWFGHLPGEHARLASAAMNSTPLVIQNGIAAPTKVDTTMDVQQALNFLRGKSAVPVTGHVEDTTANVLRTFQQHAQLPVTGTDDASTKFALGTAVAQSAMSNIASAVLSHPAVVNPAAVIASISTDRDVQRALNLLGSSPKLKEDGKIGPFTTAAIKAFQVTHSLAADGIAGPTTKAAMVVALATPKPAAGATVAGDFGAAIAEIMAPMSVPSFGGMRGRGHQIVGGSSGGQGGLCYPPDSPECDIGGPMSSSFGYDPRRFQGGPGIPQFDRAEWNRRHNLGYQRPIPGYPVPPPITQPAPPMLGMPAPPVGIGQPGAPPPPRGKNSWRRWQEIHPGTPYSDYQNWWNQYGASGAQINGDFGEHFGVEYTRLRREGRERSWWERLWMSRAQREAELAAQQAVVAPPVDPNADAIAAAAPTTDSQVSDVTITDDNVMGYTVDGRIRENRFLHPLEGRPREFREVRQPGRVPAGPFRR